MKRRKQTPPPATRVPWKTHLGWVLGTSLVLGISLTVRYFSSDSPVSAQTGPAASAPTGRQVSQAAPQASPAGAPGAPSAIPPAARPRRPEVDIASLSTMAIVNGEEISREQLQEQCLLRYGEEMLESIVSKHIILQACHDNNVVVTNGEIEDKIAEMAARFEIGVEQWLTLIESERGISANEYRSEIVWPMIALKKLSSSNLEVTQQEYEEAFEREFGPRVMVRVIVTSTRESIEDLRARALANPEEFGEIAKKYSEEPTSASQRGLIPAIRRHVGDKAVEDVAFALQPGEISEVLQSGGQYIVLMCERHIDAVEVKPDQLEQVQQALLARLREHKARQASTDLFAQLESEANVQEVLGNEELMQQMPGVAAVVNGQEITLHELAIECLERHGELVLDAEIHRLLLIQALRRQGLTVSQEMLNAEIARAAESYGYVTSEGPDVEGWLQHILSEDGATVELYVRDAVWPSVALKQLVGDAVQVSEDDLEKGFLANYGEMVRVQAIVTTNQRQAVEAWERARQCNTEEYFGELAEQYSMEPISQANAGHVPHIRQFGGQPKLEETAFRLQDGEISSIVNVGDQFVILRSLGRTEPIVQSLEDVRTELTQDIREKKMRLAMATRFEELLTTAQIDNFISQTSQSGRRAAQAGGLQPAGVDTGIAPASAAAPIVSPSSR